MFENCKDKPLKTARNRQIKNADLAKFLILVDKNGCLQETLSIKYFPAKYLIDDGVITKTWFGNFPNEQVMLREISDEHR